MLIAVLILAAFCVVLYVENFKIRRKLNANRQLAARLISGLHRDLSEAERRYMASEEGVAEIVDSYEQDALTKDERAEANWNRSEHWRLHAQKLEATVKIHDDHCLPIYNFDDLLAEIQAADEAANAEFEQRRPLG